MPPKEEKSLSDGEIEEIKEKNLAYLQKFKAKLGKKNKETKQTETFLKQLDKMYIDERLEEPVLNCFSENTPHADKLLDNMEKIAKILNDKRDGNRNNWDIAYECINIVDLAKALPTNTIGAGELVKGLNSVSELPDTSEGLKKHLLRMMENNKILSKRKKQIEEFVNSWRWAVPTPMFYLASWGRKQEQLEANVAIAEVTEKLTGQSCDLGLGNRGNIKDLKFNVNTDSVKKCVEVLGTKQEEIGELIKKNPSKADTIATNIDTISKMEKDMDAINGQYAVAENSKRTLANKHKEVFFLKKAKVGACEDLGITKDALTIDEKKVIDASKELEDIVSIENIKSSDDLKRVGLNSPERLKKCYKELLKRLDAVLKTENRFQNIINKNEGFCTPEDVVKVVRIVKEERLSNDVVNVWLGFIDNWNKTKKSNGFCEPSYSNDEYNVIDYLVPTNVNRAKMLMATLKSLGKMPENGAALMAMLKKDLDKHEILKSYRGEILSWLERFLKLPGNEKEGVTGVLLQWMNSLELFIINAGMLNVVKELGVNVELKVTDKKEKIKECLETKLKDNPVMKCIGLTANEFKGLFEDNMDAALLLASNLRTAGEYINLPKRIGQLDNENKKKIVDASGNVFELKQEEIKWNKNAVMEYKSDEFKNYLENISKKVPDLKQNQVSMSSLVDKIEHENIKRYYMEYYKEEKVPDDAVEKIKEEINKINNHHKSISKTLEQLENTYSAIKESNFYSKYLRVGEKNSPPNEGLKELNGEMAELTKKIRGES